MKFWRFFIFPLLFMFVACTPKSPSTSEATLGSKEIKPSASALAEKKPDKEKKNTLQIEITTPNLESVPTSCPTCQPVISSPVSVTNVPTCDLKPTKTPFSSLESNNTCPSAPYFIESLAQEPAGWNRSFVTGDNVDWRFYWEENRLKVFLPSQKNDSPTESYVYYTYTDQIYQDVAVEVEVINRGALRNGIAAVCRKNEKGWYEFRISSDGTLALYRYEQLLKNNGKNPYVKLAQGASYSINAGLNKVNKFSLRCEGPQLRMFLNGKEFRYKHTIYTDETYSAGEVALGAMSYVYTQGDVALEFLKMTTSAPQ